MSKRSASPSPTGLSPEGKKISMEIDNWNILKDCATSYDKCKLSLVKLKSELAKPKGGSKSTPEINSVLSEHSTDISSFMEKVMKGMNGFSDIIDNLQTQVKSLNDDKLNLENKVSELTTIVDNISVTRNKQEISVSQEKMQEKLKESGKCTKLLNLDFCRQVTGRDNVIKSCKDILLEKADTSSKKKEVESLLSTTEIFPLGKETKLSTNGIHTVPIVVKFASHKEKFAGEKILQNSCKVHGSFLWPKEAINQVKAIRNFGNSKFPNSFVRIRPDYSEGCKIKLDVKPKPNNDSNFPTTGRFDNKFTFACPIMENDRLNLKLPELLPILKENSSSKA